MQQSCATPLEILSEACILPDATERLEQTDGFRFCHSLCARWG